MRTLRELGVGDGTALVVRIGPPLTQREKAAAASASGLGGGLSGGGGASSSSLLASSSSASDGYGVGGVAGLGGSSSSLLVKHAALPGVMLAHSNAYMTALFDVLRAFARAAHRSSPRRGTLSCACPPPPIASPPSHAPTM